MEIIMRKKGVRKRETVFWDVTPYSMLPLF